MRVLVTGGAGYIGSIVAAQLLTEGNQVVVVDDLSTGHADAVPPGAEFHELSIAALDPVLGDWGIEAVIHFAAKSVVGESMREPAAYWRNNVVGTIALLDSMRAHGIGHIVFSSSAACYGMAEEQPIPETAAARPTSAYGASKLAIDLMLHDYASAYGMSAVSLRYFNVAGALNAGDGVHLGERHLTETHLIPTALRVLATGGAPLSVFGTDYPTPDGTCIRDYIHVIDLGEAHLLALSAGAAGEHHIVNLGSGTGASVHEVLGTVGHVVGREVPIEVTARRAGDPPVLIASNSYAKSLLGWTPTRDLSAMVSDAWTFEQSSGATLPADQRGETTAHPVRE